MKEGANEEEILLLERELGKKVTLLTQVLAHACVNRVFIANFEDDTKAVLRMDSNIQQYTKEMICLQHLALFTPAIPLSTVLKLGSTSNGAVPYMIETFLDGRNCADLYPSESFLKGVWRRLGQHTSIIHQLPVEGYGDDPLQAEPMPSPSSVLRCRDSFMRFVDYNIRELSRKHEDPIQQPPISAISPECADKLLHILSSLKERYTQGHLRFGLCHGDISLKNCLVTVKQENEKGEYDEDAIIEVALIDWGCAQVDVIPHAELNAIDIHPQYLPSFLQGYGMTQEEYETTRELRTQLKMLRALDTLRWALDNKQEKLQSYVNHLHESIKDCM